MLVLELDTRIKDILRAERTNCREINDFGTIMFLSFSSHSYHSKTNTHDSSWVFRMSRHVIYLLTNTSFFFH